MAKSTESSKSLKSSKNSVSKTDQWWEDGLRFECQGSGRCCQSRGEYGFVYLSDSDRKAMAKLLKMTLDKFTKTHCDFTDGLFHLKEDTGNNDCRFLEGKRCNVYEARPTQCRTWPFWPENMNAKAWNKEVKAFCPGVGKGPVVSKEKIRKALNDQILSEVEMNIRLPE
ncbi:MAG: YkgJ family cysteine cluster protein [Bdellovibrionales bacterium]|nr:YkgJ family cysteine cluster protein [Bdellovibrionales bacterium]